MQADHPHPKAILGAAGGVTMPMTYCRCGDSARVSSDCPAARDYMLTAWRAVHSGDGHGECTQAECARVRRKRRDAERREQR